MKLIGTAFLVLFALAAAAPAQAHGAPDMRIDHRQDRQHQRIEHGRQSGALTAREAARLERRSARIEHVEQRYRATNGLQRWERRDLHRRLNGESRAIRRLAHNGRCR